jgi:hypothetical protein
MSLKDLANKAKHLVIEEDETAAKPTPHVATPEVPHAAYSISTPVSTGALGAAPALGSPFAVSTPAVVDEKLYQSVLHKTDFATTPVGKAVQKYYDALEGVADPQRMKLAVGQAQKLEGITPDQVLSTFDQLETSLENEAATFAKASAGFENTQINALRTQIQQIQAEIDQRNQKLTELNTTLANNTANHADAGSRWNLVQQRRAAEIADQKQRFSTLLR